MRTKLLSLPQEAPDSKVLFGAPKTVTLLRQGLALLVRLRSESLLPLPDGIDKSVRAESSREGPRSRESAKCVSYLASYLIIRRKRHTAGTGTALQGTALRRVRRCHCNSKLLGQKNRLRGET